MRLAQAVDALREYHAALRSVTLLDAYLTIACPEFEMKAMIGRHIWADATACDRIAARLRELGAEPRDGGPPALVLGASGASASSERLAALAAVKTDLARSLDEHIRAIDPILDEPSAALLRAVAAAAEGHAAEYRALWGALAAGSPSPPSTDAFEAAQRDARARSGALTASGIPWPPPVPRMPATDARLRVGPPPPTNLGALASPEARPALIAVLHAMLTEVEIGNVEACSRQILEAVEMPWAFVVDMSRQCWDEARHGLAFLRRIEELGGRFGDQPISSYLWKMGIDQPTDVRLAIQQRIGEWSGVEGALWHARQFEAAGDNGTAAIWEYVAQDEIGHVAFGNKWLRYLASDEAGVARVHQRALAVRREHGKSMDSRPTFPFDRAACLRAGFSPQTVDDYEARVRAQGSRFA